jgi:putative methyltransferase
MLPAAAPVRVLISEPCSWDFDALGVPYLPYLWGLLKTHHDRCGADPQRCEWLEPIYRHRDPDALAQPYLDEPIDVLGLSCYTWNWNLQCRIAAIVKARYPRCLVVAGGPQPDHAVPGFFRRHPYIDAVALRDGEITFSRILDTWVSGERDLDSVNGLYLPDGRADSGQRLTGPTEVPAVFDVSPYLAQSELYEKIIRDCEGLFCATWETNRGCPFSCNYCDWGSATMSKVRRFDFDRATAELEWLAGHGAIVIYLADANFGLLPRDVELAERVAAAFRKHGRPRSLSYNYAKNSPERSLQISRVLFESGMPYKHVLSIQHTRQAVLAAADRENISSGQQIEVVREIMKRGMPVEVQLILGIPGDTYEQWQACFGDLMEWGIHGYYQAYLYNLLPNAPAAAADFRQRWGIQTVERFAYTSPHLGHIAPGTVKEKSEIIVGSATYTTDDWVRMKAYGEVVTALHSAGLTPLVAHYLRRTHGVPYQSFYSSVIDEWAVATPWYQRLLAHYRGFLSDENATEFLSIDELPARTQKVSGYQWVFVQACLSLDAFFASLGRYLIAKYPRAAALASVLEYQKEILILPDYDSGAGKTFATDRDWPGYFDRALDVEGLPDPLPGTGGRVEISDRFCTDGHATFSLDWSNEPDERRWPVWLDRVVLGLNGTTRGSFRAVTLVAQEDVGPAMR